MIGLSDFVLLILAYLSRHAAPLICPSAQPTLSACASPGCGVERQAVQMFGPAQHAVAMAVANSVAEGVIPANEADDLYVTVGVFIHWEAKDDKKLQDFNYRATKEAIARAVKGEPKSSEVTAKKGLGAPSRLPRAEEENTQVGRRPADHRAQFGGCFRSWVYDGASALDDEFTWLAAVPRPGL